MTATNRACLIRVPTGRGRHVVGAQEEPQHSRPGRGRPVPLKSWWPPSRSCRLDEAERSVRSSLMSTVTSDEVSGRVGARFAMAMMIARALRPFTMVDENKNRNKAYSYSYSAAAYYQGVPLW